MITNTFIARRIFRASAEQLAAGALLLSVALCGCANGSAPVATDGATAVATVGVPVNATPAPRPAARAIALRAASVLRPYHDPLHTFELGRPQTWGVLDARANPRFARALGDGVRFFEPISATDPDAGSAGKLWIDVLPDRPGSTPRTILLQPFVDADYPAALVKRLMVVPVRLGGVAGYRLVSLPAGNGHQVTLLVARWRGHYYRVTVFGAAIPAEVALALRSWRFIGVPHSGATRPDLKRSW